MMQFERVIKACVKVVTSTWFQLALIIISAVLCGCILWGQDLMKMTISRSGVFHRGMFFIWCVLICAMYDIFGCKLCKKYQINKKKTLIVLAIANLGFLMCGIHVWPDLRHTVSGIMLHTVPVCIGVFVFYGFFVYAMLKAQKQEKNIRLAIAFAVLCVIGLCAGVIMLVFNESAISEIIIAYGLLPSLYCYTFQKQNQVNQCDTKFKNFETIDN